MKQCGVMKRLKGMRMSLWRIELARGEARRGLGLRLESSGGIAVWCMGIECILRTGEGWKMRLNDVGALTLLVLINQLTYQTLACRSCEFS